MKKQVKRQSKIKQIALLIICTLFAFLALVNAFSVIITHAEENDTTTTSPEYSNVLDDLQKDPEFNADEFIFDAEDYSINVLTIAENSLSELIIYVYQPSRVVMPLTATHILMSLKETTDNIDYYNLELLNSNSVFCKYKVLGLTVSSAYKRVYNITSIFRKWDNALDGERDIETNDGDYKAYKVACKYYAEGYGSDVKYDVDTVNVVEILNPYVSYTDYPNGWDLWVNDDTRSHFVAFSTDWDMDHIEEITVHYIARDYKMQAGLRHNSLKPGGWETYSEFNYISYDDVIKNVTDREEGTNNYKGGWRAHRYVWPRIQAVSELKNPSEELANCQWIVRFVDTQYNSWTEGTYSTYYETGTEITEVSILRLKFISNGITYDLGCVMDVVTNNDQIGGSGDNGAKVDPKPNLWDKFIAWVKKVMAKIFGVSEDDIPDWLAVIFAVVCVFIIVILIIILMPFFPMIGTGIATVLKLLFTGLLYLFKGIFFILSLPFKGIIALIKRKKDGGSTQ